MIKRGLILFIIPFITISCYAQLPFTAYNDGVATSKLESGLTATILGNFVSQTNVSDGQIDNQSIIQVTGDWINNNASSNAFSTSAGTVQLIGTTGQTLGGTQTTAFYNLTINNSFPTTAITLASPITVNGTLLLTDGHVVTTSANLLTMGASAVPSLGATPQDSSFVKGPMANTVNVSTAVTKVYPIGKDNDYRRVDITIDQSTATSTAYTAEMINTSAQALGYTLPGSLSWVSQVRYYKVTQSPATGLDAASQQMRIYFQCTERGDFVQELPTLKVAQWDGGANWVDRVGTTAGGICSGINYAGDILSAAFDNFTGNQFSLANDITGANPLPVEFLSFDASPSRTPSGGNAVDITWTTASEYNTDYFVVQRIINLQGLAWEDVAQVNASGNSATIKDYASVDYEPYSGVSYYRLKQVDFDGKFSFSAIAAVSIDESEKGISVYPNPASGSFNVSLTGQNGKDVLLVVRDVQGRKFYSKVLVLANDKEVIAVDPSGKLASGLYFVVASSDNEIFEKKIVIK